ncbi:MAG: hypothetical protein AAF447_13865 [Myxococcota bacterium]
MRVLAVAMVALGCGGPVGPSPQELEPEARAAGQPEPPPAPETAPVRDAPLEAPLDAPDDLRFPPSEDAAGDGFLHDDLLGALANARPREFKPVGTTSIVFRMKTRSPHTAAFKPRTRQHRFGWKSEIAAYRLARLLAMPEVPPAVARRLSFRDIRNALHRTVAEDQGAIDALRAGILWEPNGTVWGAAIYWIPDMEPLELDARGTRWGPWLAQGTPLASGDEGRARDVSRMIVFDVLIGNWDRFSGGNVHTQPGGGQVFVRDHNAAFGAPLPRRLRDRLLAYLERVERFSEDQLQRLERLDADAVARALSEDPVHELDALLGPRQTAELLDRRDSILSWVGALTDRYGHDAVVCFP